MWYLLAELGTHNHAWSFGAFGTYSIAPCIITCIHHLSSLSSIETHQFSLSFKTARVKFVPKVWLSQQSSNITFPALKVVKPTHKSRETDGHDTTPQLSTVNMSWPCICCSCHCSQHYAIVPANSACNFSYTLCNFTSLSLNRNCV